MTASFTWIGGATWTLTINGITMACDPVLCEQGTVQDYRMFQSTRLTAPVYDANTFAKVDLWLLTHGHLDHLDEQGLKVIQAGSPIIAHKDLVGKLPEGKVFFIDWPQKQELQVGDIKVTVQAIPAIHGRNKLLGSLVGNANGYLVTLSGPGLNYTFYVTGDSVFKPQHKKFFQGIELDLVIANAGAAKVGSSLLSRLIGRITNDATDLENLAKVLNPRTCIPVHWGTFSHYTDALENHVFADSRIQVPQLGETLILKKD